MPKYCVVHLQCNQVFHDKVQLNGSYADPKTWKLSNAAHFDLIYIFVFHSYRGYCPQIKYRVGKTYGTDTHELARVSNF